MRRMRTMVPLVAVVASAALLLTACGSGSISSTSTSSGSAGGGHLDVFLSAQANYPTQFAAWSKDVTAKFKRRRVLI